MAASPCRRASFSGGGVGKYDVGIVGQKWRRMIQSCRQANAKRYVGAVLGQGEVNEFSRPFVPQINRLGSWKVDDII